MNDLVYINLHPVVHGILFALWVGWCWGMVKMSDYSQEDCGWVGHQ